MSHLHSVDPLDPGASGGQLAGGGVCRDEDAVEVRLVAVLGFFEREAAVLDHLAVRCPGDHSVEAARLAWAIEGREVSGEGVGIGR